MNDIKNNILHKIQSGEIQQTSRWYFITRDYVFYVLTGFTAILGALATSSILFQLLIEHAPRVKHLPRDASYLKSFYEVMPWVWVGVFVLLIVIAWFNYRHTSRAYRHHNALIIAVMCLCSLVGGFVLFKTGVSSHVERELRNRVPMYHQDVERREELRKHFLEHRKQLSNEERALLHQQKQQKAEIHQLIRPDLR